MPRTTRFAATFAVLVLVFAACGDDDTASSTSVDQPDSTTASTQQTSTSEPAPDTTTPQPAGPADLGDLADRYAETPLKVTYRIGEEGAADSTTLVLAQDPTATPPIESITVAEADSRIIISDGTTVFCDGSSGGACFELPGATGDSLATTLLGPFRTWLNAAAIDAAGVGSALSDPEPITVAGRSGTCVMYEPTLADDTDTDLLRMCLDDELGFALLMQTSLVGDDEIQTVLELLAFAAPSADDFEPSGPVTGSP